MQLERALSGELEEQALMALARLVGDHRRVGRLGSLEDRLHEVLEQRPVIRQRCEVELAVPALRAAPEHARRDHELVGLYAWTEHAGETSFARTHTTLLLLSADGRFGRGAGTDGVEASTMAVGAADDGDVVGGGDRGAWAGDRGRLLLAADCGRHESYAYVRNMRSLNLTDDQGVRRLLRPITEEL